MSVIDKLYMKFPTAGRRSMTALLSREGYEVNTKRTYRLMKKMGLRAMYPKPKKTSKMRCGEKYPYLLRGLEINTVNLAWATDITYIPVCGGFIYLSAIIDLYSRYVIAWEFSNSLDSEFCLKTVQKAFERGTPQIFNSDQGVQYTSYEYINLLKDKEIKISMTGKGRCWDNIFIERFWRTLKYEEVYLNSYEDSSHAMESIGEYIGIYNQERVHSALSYRTPFEVFSTVESKRINSLSLC